MMKFTQYIILCSLALAQAHSLGAALSKIKTAYHRIPPATLQRSAMHLPPAVQIQQRDVSTLACAGIAAAVGTGMVLRRIHPTQRLKRANKIIADVRASMIQEGSLTQDSTQYALTIKETPAQTDDIPLARSFDTLSAHQMKLEKAGELLDKIKESQLRGAVANTRESMRDAQEAIAKCKKSVCAQPDFNTQWKHLNTRSAADRAASSSSNDWLLYWWMWQMMSHNSHASSLYHPTSYYESSHDEKPQHKEHETEAGDEKEHKENTATHQESEQPQDTTHANKVHEDPTPSQDHTAKTEVTSDLPQEQSEKGWFASLFSSNDSSNSESSTSESSSTRDDSSNDSSSSSWSGDDSSSSSDSSSSYSSDDSSSSSDSSSSDSSSSSDY